MPVGYVATLLYPTYKKRTVTAMIEIARQSIAPEAGITVVLTTAGALPVGIKDELKQVIRSARGNANAIVRVFILLEAPEILPPEIP